MRYPAFLAELAEPRYRRNLWLGIWSGYAMVAVFGLLALVAQLQGLVPWTWSFYALVAAKLATNTLAAWSLRADRAVLDLQGLNTAGDIVLMTGAIYLTGGEASPLFPIYVIEIAVVALLSNLPVTIITAIGTWIAYSGMAILTHAGVLPQHPAPAASGVAISTGYLATDLVFAAFVLGVPTVYVSLILRALERKRGELEERNAALIEAGRQKSQFMANVTHELRTPIHGICGLGELLESGIYGPLSDKQKQAVASIQKSAKGQLQLVDELLTLSKADAGKIELRREVLDVGELVASAVSAGKWMLGTKKMTLVADVPDDIGPIVSDRAKLNQVLINLVSNAAKFTAEGGRIEVSARATRPGHLTIAVADTGKGIPTAELGHIFEAFRQVDGTDEREYGGVGLGLSLVARLVDLLGGEITVESDVGVGSTFRVTLPREPADQTSIEAA